MGGKSSKKEPPKPEPKKIPPPPVRQQTRPTDGSVDGARVTRPRSKSPHADDSTGRAIDEATTLYSRKDERRHKLDLELAARLEAVDARSEASADGSVDGARDTRPRSKLPHADDVAENAVDGASVSTRNTVRFDSIITERRRMHAARLEAAKSKALDARRSVDFKETILTQKKNNALLVAAIDFGTTYSGYAYSFITKPENIMTNYWGNTSIKTPTVVLMKPDKTFHSFGEEARHKYEQLMETNSHKDWYLFERFKMKLFVKETPLEKDMEIVDILGKPMKAIDVFTAAIRYIREHLIGVLNDPNRTEQVKMESDADIRWVLTVPAIWNDLSKKFMREAANSAGIPDEMLLLALEPEAASLFCKNELGLITAPAGCKYLVLDLGGGTADITCHEVNKDGTLKELYPPTGGDFGGTTVDNEFISVLTKLFGADVIKQFKSNYMNEYWELMKDFELKKRKFDGSGRVILKFPIRMLELYKVEVGETVEETLKNSQMTQSVEFKQDKMFITENLMKDIFNSAVNRIKEKTEEVLKEVPDISHLLLVGGFSESLYLQTVLRDNFDNLIVIPKEPVGAVLKGAVVYGHETKAISSRKCRYTYGIARMIRFIPGKHPEKKKLKMGKFTFCDDAFYKHIEIGTEVSVDTPEKSKWLDYYPAAPDQRHAVLEVYKTERRNPEYIDDDGCEFVGLIKIEIDPRGDVWSKLWVKLVFGGTELKIEVKDERNASVTTGSVDFLG